jgi:hypothetical protein
MAKKRLKFVADTAQAEAYFKENRSKGKDLLLISDMDMSRRGDDRYKETSYIVIHERYVNAYGQKSQCMSYCSHG